MSANPEVPAAPQLRPIREAWLERAVERLEADPAISAAGFAHHRHHQAALGANRDAM